MAHGDRVSANRSTSFSAACAASSRPHCWTGACCCTY